MTQLLAHYGFCPVSLAVLGNCLMGLVNALCSVSGVCIGDLEQRSTLVYVSTVLDRIGLGCLSRMIS